MINFDTIWKFAIIGFLLACLVTLGRIESAINASNITIKEYFAPIENVPLPSWNE